MARPRNEELFHSIKQTAYRQLVTYGYTDTTYQSIATACGVTRTAVQNYYASKPDLALDFFGDLLAAIDTVIRAERLHTENEFDTMFCIGQSFFSFLMRDAETRKLLTDTVGSREITSEVLAFEYKWGTAFLQTPLSVPEEKFRDDVIVSMGGFYELLYSDLKDDRPFDLPTHLGRVVRSIMHDHGWSYEDAKTFIAAHHMTGSERDLVLAKVSEAMDL